MIFANRTEAGLQLAQELLRFRDADPVVLALPRGGVPIGLEVARILGAPLDIVLVRKIGAPHQPELAVGAVVDGGSPQIVLNEDIVRTLGVPQSYIDSEAERQLREIERRRKLYLSEQARTELAEKTVIVVDDGIATGATARAALRAVRRSRPKWLVLAVPVAPPDTAADLQSEVDELVCLMTPTHFGAIGYFYADFHQVADEQVIGMLRSDFGHNRQRREAAPKP